jgi:hypothetical protein
MSSPVAAATIAVGVALVSIYPIPAITSTANTITNPSTLESTPESSCKANKRQKKKQGITDRLGQPLINNTIARITGGRQTSKNYPHEWKRTVATKHRRHRLVCRARQIWLRSVLASQLHTQNSALESATVYFAQSHWPDDCLIQFAKPCSAELAKDARGDKSPNKRP